MAGMDVYPVKGVAELRPPAFVDGAGQPVDPGELSFVAATETSERLTLTYGPAPEFVREARGQYLVRFRPPEAGVWYWRVDTDIGAFESYFYATPSALV